MMVQDFILLAAVITPVLLVLLLRANGAVVFLSLCAGALLTRFAGNDAGLVGSAFGTNTASYSMLGLLFAPAVLSLFFMRKSLRGPQVILNLLPSLAVGAVGLVLAVPLLPGGLRHTIVSTSSWSWVQHQQEVIVIVGVLVSLVVLWLSPNKAKHGGKHKH